MNGNFKNYRLIVFVFSLLFGSCTSNDYLISEEIPSSTMINMSTYDYLASKPAQFDQFLRIIDLTNSKESINSNDYTILIPQNGSIEEFVFENGKEEIDEFQTSDLVTLLNKYIVSQKITTDLTIDKLEVMSLFGDKLIFSLKKESWKGVENIGPMYLSINNLKIVDNDKDDVMIKVVTPDIETNTGVLHILSVNHLFGF